MYCDCKASQGTIHDLKMKLTKLLQPCNKYLNHNLLKIVLYPQIFQSYIILIVLLVRKFLSDLLLWMAFLQLWYFHYQKSPKNVIIKCKLLGFPFACDDLFSQGTDTSSGPWVRKHRMIQPLIWQTRCPLSCGCRCTSSDTAFNSHMNSTFLEIRQQKIRKLMMKLQKINIFK